MHFTKSLLVGAACAVAAVAQGLQFTDTPTGSVQPGQSTVLKWTSANTVTPVKIDLYEGDPLDLQYVRTITSTGSGSQYTWTVPADLPNRRDYSLQIHQGFDNNYSGPFQLTGSNAVSSSSSSQSRSATSTVTSASTASSASAITTSSGVVVVQSVVASNTTATVSNNNATTTVPAGMMGTGVGASGSAATGGVMSRNTTMSRPTLSSTSSESAAATTGGSTSEPTGESGGSSGGEEAPSSGAVAMEVASFASPLALVLSAVAAIMFLA